MTKFNDGIGAVPSAKGQIRASAIIVLSAALATLAGIYAPTMLNLLGHAWAVSDVFEHADAAVVLGGGFESRPAVAAQLYKDGDVGRVLVSTAGRLHSGSGGVDNINREALIKLGIPASAIVEFGDHPSNTYEEACALAAWAERNRVRRIIVPTEIFTSRRVRWILRRELGRVGVDVRVDTFTPTFYDFDDWWDTDSGRNDFGREVIKYLYYRVRYWRS